MSADGLHAGEEKMRAAGVPEAAVNVFGHYYRQLATGHTGMLPESALERVAELTSLTELPHDERAGQEALDRTAIIKLNGGLGTSMGLVGAKSLLPVKDGLTFLDVIARQTLELRHRHGARLPLVLMNSFHTRAGSLAALERHPELASDVPADFLQNREPKIAVEDLQPVSWPPEPELEWCPPGHGDVYTALLTSGMLATLLDRGYEHLFISNSDNLGAVLEPRILAWMAAEGIPFVLEQCRRAEADRKGGHLARLRDGRLILREIAQTPEGDRAAFEDVERHRFFNTNNVWVSLRALAGELAARDGVLGLPMILNRKTVDPADTSSPAVHQLESAMGAAVSVFEGARAVEVPRDRFVPVKTTNDLLALRSDTYVLTGDARVAIAPQRTLGPLFVDLDSDFYKLLPSFDARFAAGPPSLVDCERLLVRGDVAFGAGVTVRGDVRIEQRGEGQMRIAGGSVLEG